MFRNALRSPPAASVLTVVSRRMNQGGPSSPIGTAAMKYFFSSSSSRMENTSTYDKVAFIGAGKMAQAMIKPLINTKIQSEEKIAIYDVSTSTTKSVTKEFPKIQVAQSISVRCSPV